MSSGGHFDEVKPWFFNIDKIRDTRGRSMAGRKNEENVLAR